MATEKVTPEIIEPVMPLADGGHGYATDPTPRQLCALALKQGAGIDVIERFSALAERWDAIEAKKNYTAAIIKFKDLCPPIIKKNPVRGKNKVDGQGNQIPQSGPIHYHFAGYDDIKAVTIPFERQCGISTAFTFDVTTSNNLMGRLKVTVGSHTEEYTFGVPIPKGINTSGTQDFGAAQTYLKRYLYCAAFDIVVTGEDSDAIGLIEKVTPDQMGKVNDAIDACRKAGNWDEEGSLRQMLRAYEIEYLGDLPADRVLDLLADLDRQRIGRKGVKK